MIKFESPELLWLLLLVPVVLVGWIVLLRRSQKDAQRVVPSPNLVRVAYGQSETRKWLRMSIWLLAFSLLIIAVARPQIGTRLEEIKREGVDVLIAVDLSFSMLSEDFSPSRLESAKFAIQKFVNGLKGDRVGLIAFAGSAVYHCPLTTDYGAVKLLNRVLSPSIVPEPGTAVADAIRMAIQTFDEHAESKSKVLIIITDGEDHEDAAIDAASEANASGIKVYTIGMGTPNGSPIPLIDAAGRRAGYKKDQNGQVIVSQLNETHLAEIAEAGGGVYQRANPGGKELDLIWENLSEMEKTEFGQMQFAGYEDRFAYFAIPALFLLVLEFLIGERIGQFSGFVFKPRRAK